MLYRLARLEDKDLAAIKAFEKESGKTLLAYTGFDSRPAALDQREIARLKEMEKETGLVLVAVA